MDKDTRRSRTLSDRVIKPMLMGGATAAIGLILAGRINGQQFTAALWTLALTYAVVTTFRRLWSRTRFWLLLAIFGGFHAELLRRLFANGFQFQPYPCLAMAILEGALAVIVLLAIFGPMALGDGNEAK